MNILKRFVIVSMILSLPPVSIKANEESSQAQAEQNPMNLPSEKCVQTFVGTIDTDLHIRMQFHRIGRKIYGSYFYEKYPNGYLWINGDIHDNGNFVIKEYPRFNPSTGIFEGAFLNPSRMEGVWSDPDKKRSYPFHLERRRTLEREGQTPDDIVFQVYRIPQREGDELRMKIEDDDEWVLGEQCLTFSAIGECIHSRDCAAVVNSIRMHQIRRSPNFYYVMWSASPMGLGYHYTYCYYIFARDTSDVLLRQCFDDRPKQNIYRRSDAHYDNDTQQLRVADHYEDLMRYRTYTLVQGGLNLIKVSISTYDLSLLKSFYGSRGEGKMVEFLRKLKYFSLSYAIVRNQWRLMEVTESYNTGAVKILRESEAQSKYSALTKQVFVPFFGD